jgi:uncharacterized protein YjbI with pentapeptide repeats
MWLIFGVVKISPLSGYTLCIPCVHPRRASLTGVHLTGVHLSGVHLIGVHLSGVHCISHRRASQAYILGVHLIQSRRASQAYILGVPLIGVHPRRTS